jgi:trehalose 6-phosphate phosphatase
MTKLPPLDPGAALFLDIDGTLLEIAPRPELVRVPPSLPVLLDRLARQRCGALAVVSGRQITDIDRLLHPWHGAAAGMHGAERRRPDGTLPAGGDNLADIEAATALARLRPALRQFAHRAPGVLFEDKGRTVAMHYRQAPERGPEIRELAEALLGSEGEWLRLIAGKMVFELQPRHHGKDGAIAAYMQEAPFRGRVPVFLGDDVTDEDGFGAVNSHGGLSIRVGSAGAATVAAYALPSVAAALDWLAGSGAS